jgi:hypothetical protein
VNVATLEAALPALTVTALSLGSSAQVSCLDVPPAPQRTDVHVNWSLVEEVPVPDAGGLGRTMHGLRYTATVYARSATQAQRRAYVESLRGAFHHKRKPAITGLDHAEVLGFQVRPAGSEDGLPAPNLRGSSGPVVAVADVLFVGDVELS